MSSVVSARLLDAFLTYQAVCMTRETLLTNLNEDLKKKKGWVKENEIIKSRSWRRLVDVTLDNRVKTLDVSEWGQTHPKLLEMFNRPDITALMDHYDEFPFEFFAWNRSSRKVFHLPKELEMPLASAEFPDDLLWSDLMWPHESFTISLEAPLEFPLHDGMIEKYDAIMLTRMDHPAGFTRVMLRLFQVPPSEVNTSALDAANTLKREFYQLIHKKKIVAADRARLQYESALYDTGRKRGAKQGSASLTIDVGNNAGVPKLNTLLEHVFRNTKSKLLESTLRLAFGWILYLEGIGSERISVTPSAVPEQKGMPRNLQVITSPDEVWNILGRGTLHSSTATERDHEVTPSGRFQRPHWRRGHLRRPSGSLITAEKTVRVPPVLVREDLVPLYGVVGGTTTVVIGK